jgi:hypothetical protein
MSKAHIRPIPTALVLTASLLLSACGQSVQSSSESTGGQEVEKNTVVSEVEFRNALSSMTEEIDEFGGEYTLGVPQSDDDFTTQDGGVIDFKIAPVITAESGFSKWVFTIGSTYLGSEWLYHDTLDIKSSEGVATFDLESIYSEPEGSRLAEISTYALAANEIKGFCKIVNGKNVKLRISNTAIVKNSKLLEVTGFMTPSSQKTFSLACVVASGLLQGFLP